MAGRPSREKGAAGEREFAGILRAAGFEAKRDGRLDVDLAHNVPGVHFEVKRCERLELPKWLRQAERDAQEGEEPIVVFRQSREPWRAVVGVDFLLHLMHMR